MAIRTNADFTLGFTVRKRKTKEPVPLDGWSMEMQMRRRRDDPVAALTLTTENGGIVITDTPGRFEIRIPHGQTNTLEAGVDYAFDVLRTDNGRRDWIVGGTIPTKAGVTR